MKKMDHINNSTWWQSKIGDASSRQIAEFAKQFQRGDGATAWAVAVTEGEGFVGAEHVRNVVDATRADGAVAVWVSDGQFAQCVWRKVVAE